MKFISIVFLLLRFTVYAQNNDSVTYMFNFYNQQSNQKINHVNFKIYTNKGYHFNDTVRTDSLVLKLAADEKYKFEITKEGFSYETGNLYPDLEKNISKKCLKISLAPKLINGRLLPAIFFNENSITLENNKVADDQINFIKEYMVNNPDQILRISGFWDEGEIKNKKIAFKRSKYIQKRLVKSGIDRKRLLIDNDQLNMSFEVKNEVCPFLFGTILSEKYILELSPELQKHARKFNRRVEFSIFSIQK